LSSSKNVFKLDQANINKDTEYKRVLGILYNLSENAHAAVTEFQVRKVRNIEDITKWYDKLHHFVTTAIMRYVTDPTSEDNLFSVHLTEVKVLHLIALVDSIYFHISRAIKVAYIYQEMPSNASLLLLESGEQVMVGFLYDLMHFVFTGTWNRYKDLFVTSGMEELMKKYNTIIFPKEFFWFPGEIKASSALAKFKGSNWMKHRRESGILEPDIKKMVLRFHVHNGIVFIYIRSHFESIYKKRRTFNQEISNI
jgi:hypothetical protein